MSGDDDYDGVLHGGIKVWWLGVKLLANDWLNVSLVDLGQWFLSYCCDVIWWWF